MTAKSNHAKSSPRLIGAVMSVLARIGPARPQTIHAALGYGSRVTVRHTLRELVHAGRVGFEGPNCARLYFERLPMSQGRIFCTDLMCGLCSSGVGHDSAAEIKFPTGPTRLVETSSGALRRVADMCAQCSFHDAEHGECRLSPPVRLPRQFAPDATSGFRERIETIMWGWPSVPDAGWCGKFQRNKA